MNCSFKNAASIVKNAGLMSSAAKLALKGGRKWLGLAAKPWTWQSRFNPFRSRIYGAIAKKTKPSIGNVLTDAFMLPLGAKLVSGAATAPAWLTHGLVKKRFGTAPVPMSGLFTK